MCISYKNLYLLSIINEILSLFISFEKIDLAKYSLIDSITDNTMLERLDLVAVSLDKSALYALRRGKKRNIRNASLTLP